MDIEGSEPYALDGGATFFRELRPVISCEINIEKLKAMNISKESLLDFLMAWDYECYDLDVETDSLKKIKPQDVYTKFYSDFIFVPKNKI